MLGIQLLSMIRAMACTLITSIPVGPERTLSTVPLRYIGASDATKLSGDELREATGLLLDVPEQGDVAHNLRVGFPVAEHHRRRGRDTQVMGVGDHLEPLINGDPPGGDDVAQFLVQNLSGCSGQAAHAGILQTLKVLSDGALRSYGSVKHLFRGETVDVHVWQFFLDGFAQSDVEVPFHLRGQPGLDADLGSSVFLSFFGAADDSFTGRK